MRDYFNDREDDTEEYDDEDETYNSDYLEKDSDFFQFFLNKIIGR